MARQNPKENRPLINQKIYQIRKSLGLTQQEAAKKMNMKYDTYAKKERCGNITVKWALRFAEAMGVDPSCFNDVFQKNGVYNPIDFTPTKPEVFRMEDPMSGIIKLYPDTGKSTNQEEANIMIKETAKTEYIEFTLDPTEKSIIRTYRVLSKPQQKQALEFINELRKKGN